MTKRAKPDATERVEKMIVEAGQSEAARFEEEFYSLALCCESPIEELLLAALFAAHRVHEFQVIFLGDLPPSDRHCAGETIYIYQQAKVGPYRTDFLIYDVSCPLEVREPRWMIVECDGHDYHERTKEQARRDKKRDRYFQSRNYKVLRFTGSEIWADPEECANEVLLQLARDDDWRNRDA